MTETQPDTVTFRALTPEDSEVNYRIYFSTRQEELEKTGWSEEEKERFIRSQFQLQQTQYVQYYSGAEFNLMLFNGTPAGRLFLHETASEIRIMDIAVLPPFRNKGIGTAVLSDIISEAQRRGKRVSIHVEINNRAKGLYERLGFTLSELRGMYYLMEYIP